MANIVCNGYTQKNGGQGICVNNTVIVLSATNFHKCQSLACTHTHTHKHSPNTNTTHSVSSINKAFTHTGMPSGTMYLCFILLRNQQRFQNLLATFTTLSAITWEKITTGEAEMFLMIISYSLTLVSPLIPSKLINRPSGNTTTGQQNRAFPLIKNSQVMEHLQAAVSW